MAAVIDQHPVEANHAKVSREALLGEASRKREGISIGGAGGRGCNETHTSLANPPA